MSSGARMLCTTCDETNDLYEVEGTYEIRDFKFTPEYPGSREVSDKTFLVYARVRRCQGCGSPVVTYEVTEEVMSEIINEVTTMNMKPEIMKFLTQDNIEAALPDAIAALMKNPSSKKK